MIWTTCRKCTLSFPSPRAGEKLCAYCEPSQPKNSFPRKPWPMTEDERNK